MKRDYAAQARALVGTRFRPQGRGAGGLDCIGLVLAAYAIPAREVRRDYELRGGSIAELEAELKRFFRSVATTRSGDLLLLASANAQLHLAVLTERGFVHAHAGLRRVVETPGAPDWPILGTYRRRTRKAKG